MNYSAKNGIILDDSLCSRFIRMVVKAVELFDLSNKNSPPGNSLVSMAGGLYDDTEQTIELDFSLPLVCFLKIHNSDRTIAFHYGLISKFLQKGSHPFSEKPLYDHEYIILYTYIEAKQHKLILQEDFSKLYEVLEKRKLVDFVETELEKIILKNS